MAEETIKQNTLQTNGKMQNALLKIHLSSSDYNATAVQKFVQERYLVFDLLTLSWFWFQPDVGQDGSLTRIEQRAFVSHASALDACDKCKFSHSHKKTNY